MLSSRPFHDDEPQVVPLDGPLNAPAQPLETLSAALAAGSPVPVQCAPWPLSPAGLAAAPALALVYELPHGNPLGRVLALVLLPLRLAAMERALVRHGLVPEARYGVYPAVAAPSVLYQLRSAAGRYARERLIPAPRPAWLRPLLQLLERWAGCAAGTAAVVVLWARAMIGLHELLARHAGVLGALPDPSVAEVLTSRHTLLVFSGASAEPRLVVQLGPRAVLAHVHAVLERLHERVPDLVPRPLVLEERPGGQALHIATALAGEPWFRLSERTRDWPKLHERACAALARLQEAIRAVSEWTSVVRPGDELRALLARTTVSGDCARRLAAMAADLDALGPVASWRQHGDFCLNNLIVRPDRIGVIDFEEFGATSMPWHDELTLAMSFRDLAGTEHAWLPPARAGLERGHIEALLGHQILWQLAEARLRPARAERAARLSALLERYTAEPRLLLP